MAEKEIEVNLLVLLNHYISASGSYDDINKHLPKVKILIKQGQFKIVKYLELLLTSLTSKFDWNDLVKILESVLDSQNEITGETDVEGFVDIESFKELENDTPQVLKYFFSLGSEQQETLSQKFTESMNEYLNKYNCDLSDGLSPTDLFSIFIKSWIFRINDEYLSFDITDNVIPLIKGSKFVSLTLLDWISGFYRPLSKVSTYSQNNYTLIHYQNLISIEEIVETISSGIKDEESANIICNEILVPYLCYSSIDSWNCFNVWVKKLGKRCVEENKTKDAINLYGILLSLLRQDKLLWEVNKLPLDVINTLVRNIITTIYLCPKTNLQIYIHAKEILILLKSVNLSEIETTNFVDLRSLNSFDDISLNLKPSLGTINSLIQIIEVGEILYSNELSIFEIILLETSSEVTQIEQLRKYLNNEISGDTSVKKLKLLLSSIYSTLKKSNVFSKIGDDKLSEEILNKLLQLKQYDFISSVFYNEFNFLSDKKYDEIIEKYCWSLYKNAKNCDPKIGSLKDCLDCSKLLSSESTAFKKLDSLIEANSKIMDWKFYFESGHPVTPNDILEYNNPLGIIRRILELNDKAYIYTGDLYYLVVLLICGLSCEHDDPLYENNMNKSFDDNSNILAIKLKLVSLEFSIVSDYDHSYKISRELLNCAIKSKYDDDGVYELISENWFTFFQITKNEYPDLEPLKLNEYNLNLLSDLILVTPTEFNSIVLEQWQMLNSEKERTYSIDNKQSSDNSRQNSNNVVTSLGDVQARLHRSLKSSADEMLNVNGAEIGKNIIGWIVGAN